jgi:hypothetical protein
VLMYIEFKIVTVLSYFVYVYSMNFAYWYSMKIWFCERMVHDRPLVSVILYFSSQKYMKKSNIF